ncbi:MAG: MBL fold metallo-hydrolase [Vicinamibacterales bacterium]
MNRTLKRALLTLGVLVLVLVAVAGVGIAEMFAGLRPVEDGRDINGMRVIADGFSTMTLVPAGERDLVLMDAGMDGNAEALRAELARRGRQLADVKAVFLTHGHGDHIGGVRQLPNAEVIAMAAEVAIAEGRESPASPMGRMMPASPTGVRVTRTIADGETVTIGAASVRAFAVPGHTAGSAAFLVNDVLFVGDSAQINADGEIRPAPWLVTDDRAQNRASLVRLQQRLRDEQVRVAAIVAAHSGPAEGDTPLAAFAAAQR